MFLECEHILCLFIELELDIRWKHTSTAKGQCWFMVVVEDVGPLPQIDMESL